MKIIFIILIGMVILMVSLFILYKRDLKSISKELEFISGKSLDNRKIKITGNSKDINRLINSINQLLAEKQDLNIRQERKEKEIKEMIASISHDLRTPLTSIKGYTDLLIKKTTDPEDKKKLNIIKSRTEIMSDLIYSFYELSRLELKEYDFQLEYVDIKEILLELVASYYEKFQEKNIIPNINIEGDDLLVIGDEKSIVRILINIIDNAFKYSKSIIDIEVRDGEEFISMEFINDVENFNQADVKRIFDKFYIMDTSRQSESTGLGLFITRELINNMGHEIEADFEDEKIKIKIKWSKK